jgi:hypothetical protein
MILTPAPLQKPASTKMAALPPLRPVLPALPRSSGLRPVLHTARVPQQLCLDLQPRSR